VLTPRQWEVLALIREGLTDREIALRLGISLDGVKFHVSEILGKLGVTSRNEAARWAGERVASPTACLAGLGRRYGASVAQCPRPRTLHHLGLRAGGTPPGAPRQGALRSLHPLLLHCSRRGGDALTDSSQTRFVAGGLW
jgi:DNA-binding CsgD family transcriptional regulator